MQDENENGKHGSDNGNDRQQPPGADPEHAPAAGDRLTEILNRLTTLEMSLQQVRISLDSLSGNIGSVPSTMISIIGSINTLTNNVTYLTSLANMHANAVNNLVMTAGNILHQGSMIYADTQALRGCPPQGCIEPARFAGVASAAFMQDAAQPPGETGNV
jgi:hypothetical protein